MSISFRKLSLDDLPLLHKWLNFPHVHEWYDKDKENSMEDVTKRYSHKILGEKPTDCYFALFDDKPFAYIQTYRVNDWPQFGDHLWYDDATASIDLFIAEKELLGKGLGKQLIRAFLEQVVFSTSSKIHTCVIGPEPLNKRAIHVYESVGFTYVKRVQIPGEDEETYIMELRRNEFAKSKKVS